MAESLDVSTITSSLRGRLVGRGLLAAFTRLRSAENLTGESTLEDLARYVQRVRPMMDTMAARAPIPRGADHIRVRRGEAPIAGEWTVTNRTREHDRVTMHLHGGAYTLGSPMTHRGLARGLSRATRGRVWMPAYRLAPEHPFPAALDDAVTSYRWLVEEEGVHPGRIAVTGDSAGGGLALAMLVRLRDEGVPLPACYAGLSPWTDLAATGESIQLNNGRDALFGTIDVDVAPLLGLLYAGEESVHNPLISPLYADLKALPPMLVHVGEAELIRDDGVRLVAKAREYGVDASVGVFYEMWHVFQAFPLVPEARRSLREIGGFVRRHTGTTE